MDRAGRLSRAAGYLSGRYRRLLSATVVLGLGLRIATYFDLKALDPSFFHPGLDSQNFLRWAARIATGEFGLDRAFFLNPLYPYFLAPILRIFGPDHLIVIRVVQVVLGLLTILVIAAATRRFTTPVHALGAALLTAVYPLLLYYEHRVMIVTLAVFLNALTLWLVARFMDRRTVGSAALAGIPLGLSVLARPNVALFALLLPFWFYRFAPEGKRLRFLLVNTAIFFGAIALTISPVTIHNLVVGKDFVPVTSSMGANLFQSNNPEAWKHGWMASRILRLNPTLVENDAQRIAEAETGRSLKPSEVSDYWVKRTLRVMADNPGKASFFLLRKFLLFFGPGEVPSSCFYAFDKKQGVVLKYNPFGYGLIAPFMLLGVVAVLVGIRKAAPLVFLLLAYAVGLTIFYPLSHYRAPVLPAAIPLAVIGAGYLLRAITSGERRPALRAAGLLLACVIFTQVGAIARAFGSEKLGFKASDDVTLYYNRGMFYVGQGELELAEASFLKGMELRPDSALPHIGLASLSMARGEPANEARHLEDALDLEPGAYTALAHLGRNRFEANRREEGLDLCRMAAEAAPTDETVLATYASLLREVGRVEEALSLFERAEAGARHPVPLLLADQSICLRLLGRTDEARARLEYGLGLNPDDPDLLLEMVWLDLETGTVDRETLRGTVSRLRAAGIEIPEELERRLK
jgi:tetratricopeptide (TPR) repeat protein